MDEAQITKAIEVIKSDTGFEGGAEVKTSRLLEALGIVYPPVRDADEKDKAYLRRVEMARMATLAPVAAVRDRLLVEHLVDIQATGRGAYRIVPSAVQAPQAEKQGRRAAVRALREAHSRIVHTNTARLSADDRIAREGAMLNTASRIAMLTGKTAARVLADMTAAKDLPVASEAVMPQPSLRK
jgi:hypothetical protein